MKLLNVTIVFTVALLLCTRTIIFANSNDSIIKTNYEEAFVQINNALHNQNKISFEETIFIIENAYYDNKLSKTEYTNTLNFHTNRIIQLVEANKEKLPSIIQKPVNPLTPSPLERDGERLLLNWAIYTYITDTTWWKQGNKYIPNYPMLYDTTDPYGNKNWGTTMVSNLVLPRSQKLSSTKTGNCFSLAALYYIFSQRLHSEAYLVSAPQHLFIQHKGFDDNYYNIELTTRSFPGSGTIKTYTSTTHDAVVNGISMRRLNEKEAISLCLVYLAKGYEKELRMKNEELRVEGEEFMMRCANLALEYDSLCLSAMLLKTQVLEEQLRVKNEELRMDNNFENYQSLESTLFYLHKLGYRQMPQEMQSNLLANAQGMPPFSYGEKGMGVEGFLSYYTLSNNQFPEIFTNNNKYIIGNVCMNTETNTLEYLNPNQLKLANATTFDPVIFALSIDPLAAEFPSESPYTAMGNNPVNMIDPDGKMKKLIIRYVPHAPEGYESQITIKWIDYLRVYHAEEYSQQQFADMYVEYKNSDWQLEDEIEKELLNQIQADVESGRFQEKRSLQMKDFRKKRKELVPIETLLPPKTSKGIIFIDEPEETIAETPEYLKFLEPLDDLLADDDYLMHELSRMKSPQQELTENIQALTLRIESYKYVLGVWKKIGKPVDKRAIDDVNRILTETETELEKQKEELKQYHK